jgi:predicted transcriptional regulator
MVTTIQLEERIKNKLEAIKVHPRETYEEVIERLIRLSEEEEKGLSPQTIKNIEQALEDVKKGRVYSTKEVKKKLGIK